MTRYSDIIQSYCRALKTNDYQAMINLFAKDATVISYVSGEKPALEFFQNFFKTSRRTKVELKNMFIGVGGKSTVAVYIYLENILNEKFAFNFEVIDIFEFNADNKITTLRIIRDTYPLRKLLADDKQAVIV